MCLLGVATTMIPVRVEAIGEFNTVRVGARAIWVCYDSSGKRMSGLLLLPGVTMVAAPMAREEWS